MRHCRNRRGPLPGLWGSKDLPLDHAMWRVDGFAVQGMLRID